MFSPTFGGNKLKYTQIYGPIDGSSYKMMFKDRNGFKFYGRGLPFYTGQFKDSLGNVPVTMRSDRQEIKRSIMTGTPQFEDTSNKCFSQFLVFKILVKNGSFADTEDVTIISRIDLMNKLEDLNSNSNESKFSLNSDISLLRIPSMASNII